MGPAETLNGRSQEPPLCLIRPLASELYFRPRRRGPCLGAQPRARVQRLPPKKTVFVFAKSRNKNAFRFPAKALDASHPALGEAKGSSASDEPNNQTEKGKRHDE
jgi:hypothetical protein